jgi:hypothetical protein
MAPISSPAFAPLSPERVGSYALVRRLGSGGMGEVWLGQHVVSGGLGAVKRLAPRARLRSRLAAYFAREGRALARLAHPHVVPVFEVGDDFLVSAYIDGPNLARRLYTPIAPGEALRLVRQIADALAHAHDRGVVHRDVKPSNILVDGRGNAYLADFGLAAFLGEDDDPARAAGTPQFMAPEQRHGPVGPAMDQYALGRTLLEMLAGHDVPIDRDAALGALPGALPAPLCAAVARATARDPGERFPSMYAFADALRVAAAGLGAVGAPVQVAASVRDAPAFGWLAGAVATRAAGPDIERADHRLRALVDAGHVGADAAAEFLARAGLRDLGFSVWVATPRLGASTDPMALARASDVVVFLHGLAGTRESWAAVAPAVCRDNARAVAIALDLHGFGESTFAGVPSPEQAGLDALGRVVDGWRRLLGLVAIPTAMVGHSMSAIALLTLDDDAIGPRLSRIAINPVLTGYSPLIRRKFHRLAQITSALSRIEPLRRAVTRATRRLPDMLLLSPEARERWIDQLVRIPGPSLARIFRAVGDAPAPLGRHRRVALLTTVDDPLVEPDPQALDRLIADVAIPAPQVHRLASGGHSPHIELSTPEWRVRNLADIVRVIDSMLITAGEPTESGSPMQPTTMPAGPTVL